MQPDGKKIINAYESYKGYAGLEKKLNINLENAINGKEQRAARKELRKNRTNIRGFKNYETIKSLIQDFKTANEKEFNRVNTLSLNGTEIDVVVKLSYAHVGPNVGEYGSTQYQYEDIRGYAVVYQRICFYLLYF